MKHFNKDTHLLEYLEFGSDVFYLSNERYYRLGDGKWFTVKSYGTEDRIVSWDLSLLPTEVIEEELQYRKRKTI